MVSGKPEQRKSPITLYLSNYQYDLPMLVLLLTACLRRCLPGFSSVKLVFFSPSPFCIFWKENHCDQPTLEEGSFTSLHWGGISIIWNCSMKIYLLSPTYVLIWLFIVSLWTFYLFILLSIWGYNSVQLNFVVHNFPALVIESSFGYLLSPFNNPSVKLWIFFFPEHSILLTTASYFRLILNICLSPRISHFPKAL